jgi:hypothetical protein
VIASVLTIIGYGINDTVVIFDRIRENRKLGLARSWLGVTFALCGDGARARQKLAELRALEKKQYVDPVSFAAIEGALGDVEGALRSYEKAFEDRTPNMVYAAMASAFAPEVVPLPRYRAIVERMGFPRPAI